MSTIPQPDGDKQVMRRPWRPEPNPADYSDDLSEAEFDALKKISEQECPDDEFEVVDGPAW